MIRNIVAVFIAIVLIVELYLSAMGNQHLKKKLHKGWNRTKGKVKSVEEKYDTFSKKNVNEVTIEAENGALVYSKQGHFCIYEVGEEVELEEKDGAYSQETAAADYAEHLHGLRTDSMEELTYQTRKRIHNLKYYTWVEQQGKTVEELNAQWYDPEYWVNVHNQMDEIDRLINEFNDATGLLKEL